MDAPDYSFLTFMSDPWKSITILLIVSAIVFIPSWSKFVLPELRERRKQNERREKVLLDTATAFQKASDNLKELQSSLPVSAKYVMDLLESVKKIQEKQERILEEMQSHSLHMNGIVSRLRDHT